MNAKTKLILKKLFIVLIMLAFIGVNIVYADTVSEIKFCDYGGTRRTLKMIGVFLNVVKVIVPLFIMITQIISMFKIIVSGKQDDFKDNLKIFARKMIAGLLIFFIPTLIDYTIDSLIGYDDSGFTQCSNCLLDTDHCTIPDTDPEIDDGN